ncbi:ATP-binding protein [Piscinibacter koreensis]|uniref:histidine kinase n=1 Tax=Piscinibacter koreensis TaxID=2742824 RepID=A0A7Y6NPM5_9BURK|nr:ATP-binding protein [Schlegelella koreensis]NUZ06999.1 GAF domain-containing protein [Schlegelella koreensis]
MNPPVDLDHCATEPIHIPGAVQPHGCLIAFDPATLRISNLSANCAEFLPLAGAGALGRTVHDCVPAAVGQWLGDALPLPAAEREAFRWRGDGRNLVAVLHVTDGLGLLEVEPDAEDDSPAIARAVERGLRRLAGSESLGPLVAETVRLVRELTAFDRVMVYRFDADGHGSVIAEAKADELEPYLGLHYPESDIPRQARELYLRQWFRAIPDARYTPVPLVPPLRADTGRPIDLTDCSLRSVSPVHLEYMANMGVQASMSVSLIVDGRLWGLVNAIHRTPLGLTPRLRQACESVGRLVSLQLAALEAIEMQRAEAGHAGTMNRLVAAMRKTDADVFGGLLAEPDALLDVMHAEGAAVVVDREVRGCGMVPADAEVRRLAEWAASQATDGVFRSHEVPGGGDGYPSGLLVIALPTPDLRCAMWFRPEVVQTVSWGGDPTKIVEAASPDGVPRLHPRRSFALWQQTLRGHALRWSAAEMRAAADLRRSAIEIDLAAKFRREQEAVRVRDELVAVVSHDLRTPLSVVTMQSFLIQRLLDEDGTERSKRMRASSDVIQRAADRMSKLLVDLLDLAKIEAGRYQVTPTRQPVTTMLEDVCSLLQPVAGVRQIALVSALLPEVEVMADPERMFQVLSNLVGNAIKFSPDGGQVTIGATARPGDCEIWVEDQGPGIDPEQLPHLFDRYWQAPGNGGSRGFGLGLYISRGIVVAHGGQIRVESTPGKGSRFLFTLPYA